MPLDDPHPIWPKGPDCDEQCPGKWSQYHDGFAWGYEKAVAAERARIRAAVKRENFGAMWVSRAAVLAIIDNQ